MFRLYAGFSVEGSRLGNTVSAAVIISATMTSVEARKAELLRCSLREANPQTRPISITTGAPHAAGYNRKVRGLPASVINVATVTTITITTTAHQIACDHRTARSNNAPSVLTRR